MTVFDLLGIKPGDAIKVDNPWSDSGPRDVVPLALSRNGISIRAIDTRYGDIRYVGSEWTIFMHDENVLQLQDFPYIKLKLDEWNSRRLKQEEARECAKEICLEEVEREFATLDEVLSTIDIENMKVAITGTLPISRANAKSLLEGKGAIVMGTVGKQTSFLFMGNTGRYEITSKMKKAHDLGVKIITL
ncbi:BRCT domain-containing protein [Vibrio sp. 10N.261.46.E11]|uniref:NAD-dependent DNA ligase LigA n=1 Tax=Vibrio syngnathi TaxID=3034029 RepID=A0AA34XP46_9VIBR|nr:BRCT domain-containing protein [Vibrio syngnathi]ARP38917.1 NAD-dependent DNA ligase LigA [Vibrio syngnathi]